MVKVKASAYWRTDCCMRSHGMTDSRVYKIWAGMINRCHNPKNYSYHKYGGQGIKVCERWRRFENFYTDLGDPPPGFTIERRNGSQGYFPDNCQWASYTEQNRNRKNSDFLTHAGRTLCLSEWAKETGIGLTTLWYRLYKSGWPIEKALTTPVICPVDRWKGVAA